jgi:hypothetical protein
MGNKAAEEIEDDQMNYLNTQQQPLFYPTQTKQHPPP